MVSRRLIKDRLVSYDNGHHQRVVIVMLKAILDVSVLILKVILR